MAGREHCLPFPTTSMCRSSLGAQALDDVINEGDEEQ